MKQIKLSSTEMKPSHNLPIAISARCPTCYPTLLTLQRKGLIPPTMDLQTIFINRTGAFAYRCINSRCEEKTNFETINCMLKHRDFKLVDMHVNLKDEIWVNVEDGTPNLDDPHMQEYISLTYGPMKDCAGHLEWANSRDINDGAEWLRCSDCNAQYKCFIFAWYDKITNDLHRIHHEYELVPSEGKQPWALHRKEAWVEMKNAKPVSIDWMACLTEVRDGQGSTMFTMKKY